MNIYEQWLILGLLVGFGITVGSYLGKVFSDFLYKAGVRVKEWLYLLKCRYWCWKEKR